ncbi:pre-mRNA-splicing factor cwc22 [Bacidia gigantensis]|uniref:pre-mRNA-splicing factor cwc22 n=1 Tax=Bacidia gigantensis TaxID=2732470 RepID=UPI001D03EB28|nr:pre-mRNA-splicing factor cwc22 [Bacidia gigantensis]KAG8526839.1 pre-mRNA-splicing factor cwc22 [Bacidia gigantensis]
MAREKELTERFKKRREAQPPRTEAEKQAAAKKEYDELLNARSGGRYVPPARLKELQKEIGSDKSSKEYQRMAWEALKKSVNGLVNKINTSNIKHIVPELFAENLVRGKGLFARSVMRASAASTPFIPIYACLVAIVNTKLPQVGELLLHRLVSQFKKAFKRNDKAVCLSSTAFIAHLCNFNVVSELLPAQCLLLLLNKPTDDSVEIAVGLMKEVGAHLEEANKPIATAVYDQFRNLLHEADLDKRQQYSIEVLFQIRKDQYKDNPAVPESLDILPEEDLIEHRVGLEDDLNTQDTANIFRYDPEYELNEEAYAKLKAQILGEADASDDDAEYESGSSEDSEEAVKEREMEIKDQTNQDLVNLRRTIYLTIMSSSTFDEATHKLLKINLPPEKESELVSMLVEVCCQEKTYSKFHGLIGERLAKLNRLWTELFEQAFAENYETIHRRETAQLRNNAKFWGHMLSTDAISWKILQVVSLSEDDTTSSSRIFLKILVQDMTEQLGMTEVQKRFKDDLMRSHFEGLFPTDTPRNTRFAINYFTSIGMGALTEDMREHLKSAPPPAAVMPAALARHDRVQGPVPALLIGVSVTEAFLQLNADDRARPAGCARSQEETRARVDTADHTPDQSHRPGRVEEGGSVPLPQEVRMVEGDRTLRLDILLGPDLHQDVSDNAVLRTRLVAEAHRQDQLVDNAVLRLRLWLQGQTARLDAK